MIDQIVASKQGDTQHRWRTQTKSEAYDCLRDVLLVETQAEHFLRVLTSAKVSTNVYLRRIHNFALDMNWLGCPVIPKRQWPKIEYGEKRAITLDEHKKIVEREFNPERRHFYELLWHLGPSQSDLAHLQAEDIDWVDRTITFNRRKTGALAQIHFGEDAAKTLSELPKVGPLFPYLITVRPGDRATEFKQRCDGLEIKGVSLHSYRYAWAERAKTCGYPRPFASVIKTVPRAWSQACCRRWNAETTWGGQKQDGEAVGFLSPGAALPLGVGRPLDMAGCAASNH